MPRVETVTAQRYAHTMSRLTPLAGAVGMVVELMTVVALWDRPKAVAVSIIAFVSMMAFNAYVNMVGLKRHRTSNWEVLRLTVSVTVSVLTNHYTGWPLPVWLWLPYHGLANDGHRRWNWTALLSFVIPLDVAAFADGVSPTLPLLFTFLALAARGFTDIRVDVVREMLAASESQRVALDEAHEKLKAETAARENVEQQLRQAQKLEAVGRLASGVAHEINTPVQYVSDSLYFLSDVVNACARSRSAKVVDDDDLDFMLTEAPQAVELMRVGLDRIATIVRSMRQIAHADGQSMERLDVNQAVTTAVTLAMSECKRVADVETQLGTVEPVVCHGGEILQVLLNLIVNAAHAVGDTERHGKIRVSTMQSGDRAVIEVADSGSGIPDAIRDRIFEPFFTTKAIGKGTGQGLAISRGVVTRHSGTLTFETSSAGTTFRIELPLRPPSQPKLQSAA